MKICCVKPRTPRGDQCHPSSMKSPFGVTDNIVPSFETLVLTSVARKRAEAVIKNWKLAAAVPPGDRAQNSTDPQGQHRTIGPGEAGWAKQKWKWLLRRTTAQIQVEKVKERLRTMSDIEPWMLEPVNEESGSEEQEEEEEKESLDDFVSDAVLKIWKSQAPSKNNQGLLGESRGKQKWRWLLRRTRAQIDVEHVKDKLRTMPGYEMYINENESQNQDNAEEEQLSKEYCPEDDKPPPKGLTDLEYEDGASYADLQDTIEDLHEKLLHAAQLGQHLLDQKGELELELKAAEQEIWEVKAENENLYDKVAEQREEIKDLTSKNHELMSKNQELTDQFRPSDIPEINEPHPSLVPSISFAQRTEDELQEANAQLKNAETEIAQLKDQISDLKEKLDDTEIEKNALSRRISGEESVLELKTQISTLEEQLAESKLEKNAMARSPQRKRSSHRRSSMAGPSMSGREFDVIMAQARKFEEGAVELGECCDEEEVDEGGTNNENSQSEEVDILKDTSDEVIIEKVLDLEKINQGHLSQIAELKTKILDLEEELVTSAEFGQDLVRLKEALEHELDTERKNALKARQETQELWARVEDLGAKLYELQCVNLELSSDQHQVEAQVEGTLTPDAPSATSDHIICSDTKALQEMAKNLKAENLLLRKQLEDEKSRIQHQPEQALKEVLCSTALKGAVHFPRSVSSSPINRLRTAVTLEKLNDPSEKHPALGSIGKAVSPKVVAPDGTSTHEKPVDDSGARSRRQSLSSIGILSVSTNEESYESESDDDGELLDIGAGAVFARSTPSRLSFAQKPPTLSVLKKKAQAVDCFFNMNQSIRSMRSIKVPQNPTPEGRKSHDDEVEKGSEAEVEKSRRRSIIMLKKLQEASEEYSNIVAGLQQTESFDSSASSESDSEGEEKDLERLDSGGFGGTSLGAELVEAVSRRNIATPFTEKQGSQNVSPKTGSHCHRCKDLQKLGSFSSIKEIWKAKEEKAKMEKSFLESEAMVTELQSQLEELSCQHKAAERNLVEMQLENDECKGKLQLKVDQLESELQASKECAAELENCIRNLRDDLQAVQQEKADLAAATDHLKGKHGLEIAEKQQKLGHSQLMVDRLEGELQASKECATDLQNCIQELRDGLQAVQKEKADLTAARDKLKEEHRKEMAAKQEELGQYQVRVEQLQSKMEASNKLVGDLQSQEKTELGVAVDGLKEEHRKVMATIKQEFEQSQVKIEELESQLQTSKECVSKLQNRIKQTEEDLLAVKKEKAELEVGVDELKAGHHKQMVEKQQELRQSQVEVNKLENKLETSRECVAELQNSVEHLQFNFQTLQLEKAGLEVVVDELREDHRKKMEEKQMELGEAKDKMMMMTPRREANPLEENGDLCLDCKMAAMEVKSGVIQASLDKKCHSSQLPQTPTQQDQGLRQRIQAKNQSGGAEDTTTREKSRSKSKGSFRNISRIESRSERVGDSTRKKVKSKYKGNYRNISRIKTFMHFIHIPGAEDVFSI